MGTRCLGIRVEPSRRCGSALASLTPPSSACADRCQQSLGERPALSGAPCAGCTGSEVRRRGRRDSRRPRARRARGCIRSGGIGSGRGTSRLRLTDALIDTPAGGEIGSSLLPLLEPKVPRAFVEGFFTPAPHRHKASIKPCLPGRSNAGRLGALIEVEPV